MTDLCSQSQFIISAVTASNTLSVAQQAAQSIRPGTVYLDLNSASPGTKQACAALIDAAGGIYVEAGVMTSVPPYGIKVPMLLGGAQSQTLAASLQAWGLDAKSVSDKLGVASAIKMSRSVMIKGLEAWSLKVTPRRAHTVWKRMSCPLCKKRFRKLIGHCKVRTSLAAWCSMANAEPRKCAKPPTQSRKQALSPSWPWPRPTSSNGWPIKPRRVCSNICQKTQRGKTMPTACLRRVNKVFDV